MSKLPIYNKRYFIIYKNNLFYKDFEKYSIFRKTKYIVINYIKIYKNKII